MDGRVVVSTGFAEFFAPENELRFLATRESSTELVHKRQCQRS
jgi:hypothetical protein